MKKIITLLLAAMMLFSLAACGDSGSKDVFKVGVVQLVQHPALDNATASPPSSARTRSRSR